MSKRAKLKSFKIVLIVCLIVFGLKSTCFGDPPPDKAAIYCHPPNLDYSAKGPFEDSNIGYFNMRVSLFWPRDVKKEEIRLDPHWTENQIEEDNSNIIFNVNSVSNGNENVPVQYRLDGPVYKSELENNLDLYEMDVLLVIPIPEEIKRANIEQHMENMTRYYDRISKKYLQNSNPNEIPKRKTGKRIVIKEEEVFRLRYNEYAESQPGIYQIHCSFQSYEPKVWNGEIVSKPLVLDIKDNGSYFENHPIYRNMK